MKRPSEIVKESWGFGNVEFERTLDFRVPPGRLFSYVADPRNLPSWREEVRKVRGLSRRGKKRGPGERCVLDVLEGETPVEVRVEVSGFEKDRLLELKIESKAYCALERYGFEEAGGGTNLEFSFKAIEPGFLVRTLALFMGSAFREDLDRKLESLKAAVASKGRGRKGTHGCALHLGDVCIYTLQGFYSKIRQGTDAGTSTLPKWQKKGDAKKRHDKTSMRPETGEK